MNANKAMQKNIYIFTQKKNTILYSFYTLYRKKIVLAALHFIVLPVIDIDYAGEFIGSDSLNEHCYFSTLEKSIYLNV